MTSIETAAIPNGQPRDISVAAVISAYLAKKRGLHAIGCYGDAAIDNAQRYLGSFSRKYGERAVAACSNDDLEDWIVENPQWDSPHTKMTAIGYVVTCFLWGEGKRLFQRCPFRRPRKPPWGKLLPRTAMLPGEFRALMSMARRSNGVEFRKKPSRFVFRAALWFLWRTGCRTKEMRDARWLNLDWETGLIVMEGKTTKATGDLRIIVLGRHELRLMRLLRARRPNALPSEHIFLSSRRSPWTKRTYSRLFRKYADLAGIRPKVTAYCARHGFCCTALEAGVGERQIADLMGQKSTRYISWYGRSVRTRADYLRGVAEQIHRKKSLDQK